MLDEKTLEQLVSRIVGEIGGAPASPPSAPSAPYDASHAKESPASGEPVDLTSPEQRAAVLVKDPEDYDAVVRMKGRTSARIGVGRAGPRLNTRTLLTLRADHALARDAVFSDVDPALLERAGLFSVQTRCKDKNEHITRPDLGRQLDDKAISEIKSKCQSGAQVQIILSDGLSSKAIEANLESILPALTEGLRAKGIACGTPFFVRFGRVAVEDVVAEALGAKVVCIFVGERPGLGTAESMSAYLCYEAKVGQPEARRTVVSNIYSGGISAVEAGAYIVELIEKILAAKASGVDLKH